VTTDGGTLRIDGLKVSRGGHPVLHGISLEVPQGAVTTLLGPNGAGKSTAVRTLTTLTRPDSGRALEATLDQQTVAEYAEDVFVGCLHRHSCRRGTGR